MTPTLTSMCNNEENRPTKRWGFSIDKYHILCYFVLKPMTMKNLFFLVIMLAFTWSNSSEAQHLVQTAPNSESWSMPPTTLPEPMFVFDNDTEVKILPSEDGKRVKSIVLNMPDSRWQEIHDSNPFQLLSIEFLLADGGTIPAANVEMQKDMKGVFTIPGNGMLVLKDGEFCIGNRPVRHIQLAKIQISESQSTQ